MANPSSDILVRHWTIPGHVLKKDFGIKYKRYKHQRPIDDNHVRFLRSEFIKTGSKFKSVVGQFVLARTKEEVASDSKYSVLDGNHRWNALLGIADNDSFLDNTFQCLIYDKIDYKMQRELFRNINLGKPMSGMYYSDGYLKSIAASNVKTLKLRFPNMITNDPNKLWMCSYNQSKIEKMFTLENMEILKITDLTSKSVADLITELNKKIFISIDSRLSANDWWHSIDGIDLIPEEEWDDLLELYKKINEHGNVRKPYGLEKTMKYAVEKFIKYKKNNCRADIPCFLPLVWRTNLVNIISKYSEEYDKEDEDIEED
jgi:hypothetical protein